MKREIALKIIEQSRTLHDKIAKDFSDTRNFLWPEFEYFKGYLKDGQDILDLGCGNGRLAEFLQDYQVNYLGVDNSAHLVDLAKSKWLASPASSVSQNGQDGQGEQSGPDKKFVVADALDLSALGNQKFDLIFLVSVMHHIPSQKMREQVLGNIKSLLKPDGKLLMINWNLWQRRFLKYIIKYTILKLTEPSAVIFDGVKAKDLDLQDIFKPWQKKYPRYIHAFTERNISGLLKKSGFEIIKNVSNRRNMITIAKLK